MRGRPAALVFTVVALAGCAAPAGTGPASSLTSGERFASRSWTFDQEAAGSIPVGAAVFDGSWAVRAEPGAPSAPNALCQTGSATYPAIGLANESHRDMRVSARVKPISGGQDRAAGVLLRVRDQQNYYIVRANALENNVAIFKYVNGSRSELKTGSATVPAGAWQELRGEIAGSTIRGYLDGRLVAEATDPTFSEGGAGLWTKSDSVTCFDDVSIAPIG
jgi:concanavalin A-like lectin/glucanase superfamily protein